ncbi:MAG: HEAT repeat domain-containing protein [Deltaproteobacteria bacterium]|nr:HEAT repeat domain-containing protein [Deltaproteobacteria bacterium]
MSDLHPRSRVLTLEAALRDLGSADPQVRAFAAGALGSAEGEDSEPARAALHKALRDDRGEVRYAAALSLGELGDRDAVAALCDQLEADGDRMARQAAVLALAMIGDGAAWGRLELALEKGPADVRYQAAGALAELDPARARPLLERALGDSDAEVREAAATALGQVGDPASADALAAVLGDKRRETRAEAAIALAQLGDRRSLPGLAELAGGRDLDVGLSALMAALPVLRGARQRGEGTEAGASAPELAAIKAACVRVVDRFFGHPLLKVWAAANLAALGDPRGEHVLARLGKSRRADVRGSIEEARAELAGRARPIEAAE